MKVRIAVALLLLAGMVLADSTQAPFLMLLEPGASDSTLSFKSITGKRCEIWSVSAYGDTVHFLVYFKGALYDRYVCAPGEGESWIVDDGRGHCDSITADLRSPLSRARVEMY